MIGKLVRLIGVCILPLTLIACGGGVTGDANNYIVVEDQTLIDLNKVQIAEVSLKDAAWIVIYQSRGPQNAQGNSSDIIGHKSLDTGSYGPVEVDLDRDINDGELLYAELRQDSGVIGEFDPQTDPLITQNAVTSVSFLVNSMKTAYLDAGTGEIHKNSLIVKKVIAEKQSWLVLRNYSESASDHIGNDILAMTKLEQGNYSDLALDLVQTGKGQAALNVGEKAVLALYENTTYSEQDDTFDPVSDTLVSVNGNPVVESITIKSPSTTSAN